MAVASENSKQENPVQNLGFSFGGEPIHAIEEPQEKAPETGFAGVSLVDNQEPQGLVSLVNATAPATKLTDEELNRKVDRFTFALGKDFSKDDIHRYLSTGNEDQLRQVAAQVKDIKDQKEKTETLSDLLSQGMPTDPKEQSILYDKVKAVGSYTPANNPMTIVEEAYAKRFVEEVPFVGPENETQKVIMAQADKIVDAEHRKRVETAHTETLNDMELAERLKLTQEIHKDVLEKAQTKYDQESTWGKIIDFGKSATPFYDYYNMTMDVPGMERASILPGTTIAQWITHLYDQPPAVQKEWLQKAVNVIGEYNPGLAVRVAEAAVNYSTTDQAFDNVFGVLDLKDAPGLGAAAVVGAAAATGAARAAARRYAARNAFRTSIAASAAPNASPGAFHAAMGNINGAAVNNVAQGGFPVHLGAAPNPQQVANNTPTFMNPQAGPGTSTGLAGAQTSRFSNFVQQRAADYQRQFEAAIRINRLPEIAHQMAMDGMRQEFEDTINQSVSSALQNARVIPGTNIQRPVGPVAPVKMGVGGTPVRPENTSENLARWEFEVSKPNGQLFSDPSTSREIDVWANLMGLQPGDYGARQTGNGWVMTLSKPLDETKPYVRDNLIKTTNVTPKDSSMGILSWVRRGGARVSEFNANNRIAYVTGQEKLREILEPLAQTMISLKKNHVDALNRVMTEEAQRINPSTNQPGMFFVNQQEFDAAYRRLNGRSPTRRETDAYIAARTLNDLEFGLRNSSYYKELARLGIKNIELNVKTIDPSTGLPVFSKSKFEGKVIDKLPVGAEDAKSRAMVTLYHEGDPDPKVVPLHALMTEKGQGHLAELRDKGYKIIQTANPVRKPGKEVFGDQESVNFIITKDFHASELNANNLINYREGWHQIYPQKWFIKQPVVRKIDNLDAATGKTITHHLYEGETVHMGFHTEAEARKYGQAMETARQIAFEGRAGNLDQHLADTLPYTRQEFDRLFTGQDPKFSKTEPFHVLGDGQISMDSFKIPMQQRYPDLYDAIRSPWNLMNQVDKKFVGHRDELLHTVKEGRGTQAAPVFNLARAETLDPLSAMSEGMANMIRNQHMIDMRLQFGESFIAEFKHLFKGDEQTMYNDLVNTILNPPYLDNIKNVNLADYTRAENARRAFTELLNLETPFQMSLEGTRSKVLDQIYERLGQEASNDWATSNLMTTTHPLSFFRGIVYHTKVGFLNPLPALQNAIQMANVLAISPVHGTAAFAFAHYAWLTRLNSHPNIVDALGEMAERATLGKYKKEWFGEAVEAMKKSGFFSIGNSQAIGDYLDDPRYIRKQFGVILDGSSFLFNETNRQLRTHAFMTAFIEHKIANPTKPFTSIDLNEVLGRARLYEGRMTRDEKARWQSGDLLSTFSQFWSYPARLMEMLLEKGHGRKDALTGMEKLRLIGMNSVLYGVPIGGLGAVAGGLVNPYDHLKQKATEYGVNTDDGFWAKVFNGVVGEMSKEHLGVNASPALGPQGRDLSRALEQDYGWFRFLMGASGGFAVDSIVSGKAGLRSAWMALNGDVSPKAAAIDLLDIARNVTSVDKATKMYLAYQNHKVYTKMGQDMGVEVETWPGLMSAILGQPVNEVDHISWERKVLQDYKNIEASAVKAAQKDYRLAIEAHANGDLDQEAFYAQRMRTWIKDLPPSKQTDALHKVYSQGTATIKDTTDKQWRDFRPEASEEFEKAFGKYFTNVPTRNNDTAK